MILGLISDCALLLPLKKHTLSLVQQLCVLLGGIAICSEYLVYGIDISMITKLIMCRLGVLTPTDQVLCVHLS